MIRELVIISGKGGTGKTSVTASFAFLARDAVTADCDVDAADLHLVMGGMLSTSGEFQGGKKAFIDPGPCDGCGLCVSYCRFGAIDSSFTVDPLACEGCTVCAHFCPRGAIAMKINISGKWFVSTTAHGPLVHARLGIAEGNSGKLVTLLRNKAREIAARDGRDLVLIDGSPGTGCPVIASVSGASFALIVTEPTVSGIHDLKRVHELTRHFRVKTAVCVNKADINDEKTREISEYCVGSGIPLLTSIPYDPDITGAQLAGKSAAEHSSGPAADAMKKLWEDVTHAMP
jgi:MinD superfamily P-loop ATPase